MARNSAELVGILNVTPDSFSDGGLYDSSEKAIVHAIELNEAGASYIDVGAESTRPGARPLTPDQEWQRLYPVLAELRYPFEGRISLDTYHPETVYRAARDIGNVIVNDVTGFNNPATIQAVSELRLQCIASHLPAAYGQDIQKAHQEKPVDSVQQVVDELLGTYEKLQKAGVHKDMIILDPGIGFGKTMELNWKLLSFASEVKGIDVMIGYSRKRFLGEDRMELEPNLAAGRIAIAAGAKLLRVHDVAGHKPLIRRTGPASYRSGCRTDV